MNEPIQVHKVPPEVSERVRELLKVGQIITAIMEVRRVTGMGLKEAKDWVDQCGHPIGRDVQTGPCPYCGKELRTDVAKLCRHCRRDWHNPKHLRFL